MVSDSEDEEDGDSSGVDEEGEGGYWGMSDEEGETLVDEDEVEMRRDGFDEPRFPGYFFVRDEAEQEDRRIGHSPEESSPPVSPITGDEGGDEDVSIDPRLFLHFSSATPDPPPLATIRPSTPRPGLIRTDSSPLIHLDATRSPKPASNPEDIIDTDIDVTSLTPRLFVPKPIPIPNSGPSPVMGSFQYRPPTLASTSAPIGGGLGPETILVDAHVCKGKGKEKETSIRRKRSQEVIHKLAKMAEKEFGGSSASVGGGRVKDKEVRVEIGRKEGAKTRFRGKSLMERAGADKLEVVVEEVEDVEDPGGWGSREVRVPMKLGRERGIRK